VQRGRSPFAGRLGDVIGSGALTLTDDGRDPGGIGSSPFDGEGTPRGRTPLIEGGTLANYLHDSYTARREGGGTRSTGNASRAGYRSPPSVGSSNLIVAAGDASLDGLLADARDGVYVTDVSGLHSGVNPVSGTFSVGATGILIENGELTRPANEFTIASDLVAMLTAVRATGAESRWVPFGGSVRTPPLLIGQMAVGGV
jgi:PmbA protein